MFYRSVVFEEAHTVGDGCDGQDPPQFILHADGGGPVYGSLGNAHGSMKGASPEDHRDRTDRV